MTIQEKITGFFQTYLGTKYKVIAWYDESEEVEPEGEIAINVHSIDNMQHCINCQDYKISVSVNGQTITEEDKNKAKINAMFCFVQNKLLALTVDTMSNNIDNVVGIVLGEINHVSDGDTNNFECSLEIYVCDLVFED